MSNMFLHVYVIRLYAQYARYCLFGSELTNLYCIVLFYMCACIELIFKANKTECMHIALPLQTVLSDLLCVKDLSITFNI